MDFVWISSKTQYFHSLDLHFASPDLDFDASRPRCFNVLGLFLCYITTLLHCYFVTLLLCYFATLLLCCWRGGGVAALLRCWIRRARPCACAWRTESHTLTSYPYHTSLSATAPRAYGVPKFWPSGLEPPLYSLTHIYLLTH